jgi:RHS repeat-associated protein
MRDDKDGVFNTNFAPFGDRRNASKWDFTNIPKPEELANLVTRHGFTGHIGLEEFGLIHMQGRVYDPKLGRFLSADPFVQAPFNTQSLNRYTYCLNNPLRYIDPSGFWWGGKGGSTRGLPSSCGGRGGNRYTTNGNSSYNGGGSPGSVNFSSLGHKSSGKSRFGISAPSRSTMAYAGLPGGIDPGTWAEQHPNAYNDYMLSQGRSFNQANDEQGKIYTEDTCQVDGESLDIELVSVDDKTKNIINGIQILDDMMTAFSLYSFLSGLGDIADVCDQARQLRNMKNYCAGNDLDPRCKPWTTTEGSRRLDSGIEYYENKCLNGLGKKVKEGANLSY